MRDWKLSFTDAYETEKTWIVADTLCNACFELEKATGKAEYLFSFEGEKALQSGLYHGIYSCGRELIFAPGYAKHIDVWNRDAREHVRYSIVGEGDTGNRYVDSYRIGDILWLLPSSLDQPIVIFDIKKRRTEYWNHYMMQVPEVVEDRKKPVFFMQYAKNGTQVYTVIKNSPYLVCFDLEKRVVSTKRIGDYELSDVACDKSAFWFSMRHSDSVIRWEPDTGCIETYEPRKPQDGTGYSNIIENQGRLLLVPNTGNEILESDPLEKELKVFCKLPEGLGKMQDLRNGWRRFFSYKNLADTVRLYPNQADYMVDIHVSKREAYGRAYEPGADWFREVFQKKILKQYFADQMTETQGEVTESRLVDLEAYLGYVEQMESRQTKIHENNCGERIYQALR